MTFINGVLLGSVGALACVLGLILFFRWVMTLDATLDQTVVQSGLPLGELLRDMCIFTVLSALALAAFWGELRRRPWRVGADWLLAVALTGVAVFFFAEPAARPRDLGVLGVAAVAGMAIYGMASSLGLLARISRWLGD
jgi:hypothetical protein